VSRSSEDGGRTPPVQQTTRGRRGRKNDPLYRARRTLHTGVDLLTDKQAARLTAPFAIDEHVEEEATWGIYQRMIAAYRHPDPAAGRELMVKLIESLSAGVVGYLGDQRWKTLRTSCGHSRTPLVHPAPGSPVSLLTTSAASEQSSPLTRQSSDTSSRTCRRWFRRLTALHPQGHAKLTIGEEGSPCHSDDQGGTGLGDPLSPLL
jgi:hypothetical protein